MVRNKAAHKATTKPNTMPKGAQKSEKNKKKLETTLNSLMTLCSSPAAETMTKLTKLQELLGTLKSLQPASVIIPKRTPEALATLLETYTTNPPFKAVFTDAEQLNATLATTRTIPCDEAIIKIPVSCALQDVVPEELEGLTDYLPLSQDASLRLILNLLYHANTADSTYRSYINALPASFENLLNYSPKLLRTLPKRVADTAQRVLSMHVRIYCMVHRTLGRLGNKFLEVFSWVNYEWACGVVLSRQNALPDGLGLVPVWDLVEHDPGFCGSEVLEDGDEGVYVMLRGGGFEDGAVVKMDYGRRGNVELLLYGGFVVEGNRDCVVDVVFPVEGSLAGLKTRVLGKLGVRIVDGSVVVAIRYGGVEEVMQVLRVVVMDKVGLVGVMRDGLPGECEEDNAARGLLKSAVAELLEEYEELLDVAEDERVRVLLNSEMMVLLSVVSVSESSEVIV